MRIVARTAQGIIGMILKDTKSIGVHVIYQESDIPTDLGADNIAYPERFWDHSNAALQCSECTDKLCTQYCHKLRD